jgi:hypothetical protein
MIGPRALLDRLFRRRRKPADQPHHQPAPAVEPRAVEAGPPPAGASSVIVSLPASGDAKTSAARTVAAPGTPAADVPLEPRLLRQAPGGKHILPDWEALLATSGTLWADARARATTGPRVLIATNVSGHSPATVAESLLAVALTLRGAQVETLVCDQVMPACLRAQNDNVPDPGVIERYELPKALCVGCSPIGEYVYGPLNLPYHRFSEFLSAKAAAHARAVANSTPLADIQTLQVDGLPIGEHAYAGALRYFARGDIGQEPHGEMILRRFLEASLQTAAVMRSLIERHQYDAAIIHHGIYVPQGIASAVANQAGIRVATWNPAYRTSCFIFSHDDTYHHTLLTEPTSAWENLPWTPESEQQIMEYLASRQSGARDWIWFHDKPSDDFVAYADEVGLDLAKPIIGMLSNVVWDAQLHYRANAFPSMVAWVLDTIRYFATRPDLQLLLRVHPAEIRGTARSRQPLVDEIAAAFPTLPPNVFIIPPESQVSTYAAMAAVNAAIIYGTKTGVELTSAGIPTIVPGEAWIRNKGLTLDASTPEEYFGILDTLPLAGRMAPEQVTRARKYAYHFFFRRMIPLPSLPASGGWPPFKIGISSLEDLLPGRQPGLDVVCDGILSGTPFVYPAEQYGIHDEAPAGV